MLVVVVAEAEVLDEKAEFVDSRVSAPPGAMNAEEAFTEARLKRIVVAAMMEATAAYENLMVMVRMRRRRRATDRVCVQSDLQRQRSKIRSFWGQIPNSTDSQLPRFPEKIHF